MSLYVCRVNSFEWNSEPRILTATVAGQFSLNGVQVGSSGLLDSTFHSLAGLGIQRTVCEQSKFWCQWRMSSHHGDLLRVNGSWGPRSQSFLLLPSLCPVPLHLSSQHSGCLLIITLHRLLPGPPPAPGLTWTGRFPPLPQTPGWLTRPHSELPTHLLCLEAPLFEAVPGYFTSYHRSSVLL